MGNVDVNGTSLQGYLRNVSYQQLVDIFGVPNSDGDGYKTDVEWEGEVNGNVFTIYNWKNGPNYCGYGNVQEITDWNIGGRVKSIVDDLGAYVGNYRGGGKMKNYRTSAFEDLFALTTTLLDDLETFGSENGEAYRLILEKVANKRRGETDDGK